MDGLSFVDKKCVTNECKLNVNVSNDEVDEHISSTVNTENIEHRSVIDVCIGRNTNSDTLDIENAEQASVSEKYVTNEIKVCQLNVNGWTMNNGNMMESIVEYAEADIFCVNEMQFSPKSYLEGVLSYYEWIGHNRKCTHVNAPHTFGGVGIFVKNDIMNNFKVQIIDKDFDGSLAVTFVNITSEYTFVIIAYLPPEHSMWGRDGTAFYKQLVTLSYSLNDADMILLAGDWVVLGS